MQTIFILRPPKERVKTPEETGAEIANHLLELVKQDMRKGREALYAERLVTRSEKWLDGDSAQLSRRE